MDLDQDVDFIGKAALKRIVEDGIKRRFCGVIMDGEKLTATNSHQWEIHQMANMLLASAAAYSPRLD